MPTAGQDPPGTARRWAASVLQKSISLVPAATVAVDPETVIPLIRETSMTSPAVVE